MSDSVHLPVPAKVSLSFLILGLGLGLGLSGCGREGGGKVTGGADSSLAAVEGRVEPSDVEARVYLSRGGEIDSTVTRDGWFQLTGIEYGLYVLEARAEGYGGNRQLVSIGSSTVLVGSMRLPPHPWPIALVMPRDSLVLRRDMQDPRIGISFSRFMDRSSVESALRMEPASPLSWQWSESHQGDDLGDFLTVVLEPEDLQYGEPYTFILDTSARTREGHALDKVFTLPVVRRYVLPGEGTLPIIRNQDLDPLDSIRIDFPQIMDMASVTDRIYLFPATPFTAVWDTLAKSLLIVPDPRWKSGEYLSVGITPGYRSSTGQAGVGVSARLFVHVFGIQSSRSGDDWGFADEHLTVFNMPVDFASLEYRIDSDVGVTARQTAPDRILWAFRGGEPGRTYSLRIESLRSQLGDSLEPSMGISYRPSGSRSHYRFLDSAQGSLGILPYRDTLRVGLSQYAYLRLATAAFSLAPDFPVQTRLQRNPEGGGILSVFSPQPWPAGTGFKLFPDTGAVPGDTLAFSTRFLEAQVLQPFQGETLVEPTRTVELRWNTLIDTVGFAGRLRFEPAVDSLRIEQDTLAGRHRTRIRHAPFANSASYRLEISGVSDLFSQEMRDTLEIRFRTRP